MATRLGQVFGNERELPGSRPRRVGQNGTARIEDDHAPPGRRELLDEPFGRLKHAVGVDVLGECAAGVLGVSEKTGVERALQFLAEDDEHAGPEGDEGRGEERGVDQRQPGPDRPPSREKRHPLRT